MYKHLMIILLLSIIPQAYGQQMLITLSDNTDKIVFDGKWTFGKEWSRSSEVVLRYSDGTQYAVRFSHDYRNLFILIDDFSKKSHDNGLDRALICIDSNNDKSDKFLKDDYCFSLLLGSKNIKIMQGDNNFETINNLENIENLQNVIGVAGISEYDRYSKEPHATYEFKIPVEVIGISDRYGFFISVFDAKNQKEYQWPQLETENIFPKIPTPDKWGELISPDKSLPEFNLPILTTTAIMALSLVLIRYFGKNKFKFNIEK